MRLVIAATIATLSLTLLACQGQMIDRKGGLILLPSSVDPQVTNGWAYAKASLDVSSLHLLIVPDDADIRYGAPAGGIVIYTEKHLSFAGHPPYPMHIRDARNYLGIACKIENKNLTLATYGEWDSHIEGGAGIRVRVDVPSGFSVRKEKGLSGEMSKAKTSQTEPVEVDPPEMKKCYWYCERSPALGWQAIAMQPDTNFTLRAHVR